MTAKITETRRIVKKVIKETGKGVTIFNDRLRDGRRSVKVWGWDLPQYELCERRLKAVGIVSSIVTLKANRWDQQNGKKIQYRLRVYEYT